MATVLAILGQEGLSFLGGALASFGSSAVQSYNNRISISQAAQRLNTTNAEIVSLMNEMNTDDASAVYAAAELTEAQNVEELRERISGTQNAQSVQSERQENAQSVQAQENVQSVPQTNIQQTQENTLSPQASQAEEISPAARALAQAAQGQTTQNDVEAVTNNVASQSAKDIASRAKATAKQIRQFVRNAFTKSNEYQYIKVDDVSSELSSLLKEHGINTEGYSHVLRDNDIRHIINSHGESTKTKYPVTEQTFLDIANAIENYDTLYRGYDTKSGNPTIVFEYHDGQKTFYVEEVMEDGVLSSKQIIIVGVNSKPSFLNKYTKIADKVSDTDVAAQSRATSESSPGNHVPDADTNVSDSESGTLVPSSDSILAQTAPTVNENSNMAMSSGTSERIIPLAQETQIPNGFTPYGTRTAQTPQTVREASITPESTKQTIDSRTAQGQYNYMPVTNDEAKQSMDILNQLQEYYWEDQMSLKAVYKERSHGFLRGFCI